MAPIEGAILPKGSWIIVTGANGYVASHVIDQLLRLGYNARGTVRDAEKSSWLTQYFSKKFPDAKFQLVEVKDLTDVAALEKAAEGESGERRHKTYKHQILTSWVPKNRVRWLRCRSFRRLLRYRRGPGHQARR